MTDNYHTAQFDKDKQRPDLLLVGCPVAIADMVAVLTSGAVKYSAHSWRNVPDAQERYRAAMLRHVLAFCSGEDTDLESDHPHLAHVAVNAAFLLEFRDAGRKAVEAIEATAGAVEAVTAGGTTINWMQAMHALEEEMEADVKRRRIEDDSRKSAEYLRADQAARVEARCVIADMDAEAVAEADYFEDRDEV